MSAQIISGIVVGIVATGIMSLTEIWVVWRWGIRGAYDWHQNQIVASWVLKRPADDLTVPGLLIHFSHGALAGIFFILAVSLYPLNIPVPILGTLFGIILWLISLVTYRAIGGTYAWEQPSGKTSLLLAGIVGHILYGAFLGLLI